MGNDQSILRKTMRELGAEHTAGMATRFGTEAATNAIYSYMIGEANGLAVLNGNEKTADFLYKLADHYAVDGVSAEEFERIGNHIKAAAIRGGKSR